MKHTKLYHLIFEQDSTFDPEIIGDVVKTAINPLADTVKGIQQSVQKLGKRGEGAQTKSLSAKGTTPAAGSQTEDDTRERLEQMQKDLTSLTDLAKEVQNKR